MKICAERTLLKEIHLQLYDCEISESLFGSGREKTVYTVEPVMYDG